MEEICEEKDLRSASGQHDMNNARITVTYKARGFYLRPAVAQYMMHR